MAKPKIALVPSAQGSKFYSVLPSSGVGDFTFSRSGSATRINSQGLIETVGNGVSRLNYPMIDGEVVGCPHHLLEPSRTNLQVNSEEFDNALWNKTRSSIIPNDAISPSGLLNADKLVGVSGSSSYVFDGISVTYEDVYTISVFAKYIDINEFVIVNFTQSGNAYFNIENGTIISNTGTFTEPKIENYGNGWYRCSAKFTATATGNVNYGFFLNNAIDKSVHIWGAQFEQGSYPTSYIPNYGTALGVTRSAETATGSGDADTFNDSEGVLMAEISALDDDSTNRRLSINKDAFNRISIELTSANVLQFSIRESTVFRFFETFAIDTTINNKLALKYKSGNSSLWINGLKLSTKSELFDFTGNELVRLSFDDSVGSTLYSKTKQIQYYDSALIDSELEELTSWTSFTDMANGQLYSIQ